VLKIRGSQLRQAATELLVDIAGPDALPVGPNWAGRAALTYLNYRKVSVYGGSNEVQRNIIAKTILGL
jgi:alkylation response protein AidB-like acyl-CoA dehydrogenase